MPSYSFTELLEKYGDFKMSYLVNELIEKNSLNLLVGQSGLGKSFISQYLTKCIVDNEKFFGKEVDPGFVLYFDNEMSPMTVGQRIKKINYKNHHLARYEYLEFPDPNNIIERKKLIEQVKDLIENKNLKLILIDSLSACKGSLDENSNNDMKIFLDFLKELRDLVTVIVIHHKGKSLHEYRGASIIEATCDNILFMPSKGVIKIVKNRNGSNFGKIIKFDIIEDENISFTLKSEKKTTFEDKKDLSDCILENLIDGMNQSQLIQKMRTKDITFSDKEVYALLKNMKEIDIRKGIKNSSLLYRIF